MLVELPGGALNVEWSSQDNHVRIEGPAEEVYSGVVDLAKFITASSGNN